MRIKNGELHFWRSNFFHTVFQGSGFAATTFLQLFQYLVGAFYQGDRHASHFCHMDTEAMGGSAGCEFAQKDYFISKLPACNMIIFYSVEQIFQFIQFVIMCCEKRFWFMGRLMQEFCN